MIVVNYKSYVTYVLLLNVFSTNADLCFFINETIISKTHEC